MITDYATLQTAIADWVARDDAETLAAIPLWIALAEARITRKLRDTTLRATITIADESTPIPADVGELRSVRLSTGSGWLDTSLMIGTPEILDDYRARSSNVSGRPRIVAILGGDIISVPAPDSVYSADITYYQKLIPLSATNTTNVVLTMAPDAYLYGALVAGEGFLEHDERMTIWKAQFEEAIDELNAARSNREYGAGTAPARMRRVF